MTHTLPKLCAYGANLRKEYLDARQRERELALLLYQEHIDSCPVCQMRMQAEAAWAVSAPPMDFDPADEGWR